MRETPLSNTQHRARQPNEYLKSPHVPVMREQMPVWLTCEFAFVLVLTSYSECLRASDLVEMRVDSLNSQQKHRLGFVCMMHTRGLHDRET